MRFNRRQYSSLIAGIGITGLAGCVNVPERDEGGQDQQASGDESESSENNDGGSDEPGEEEEEAYEEFGGLYQEALKLFEFTGWKINEFSASVNDYRSGLVQVERELESLLDQDMSSLTQAEMDNVFASAEQAMETDDRLDEFYGSHPNLSAYARNLENDLQRDFDRSEHDSLRENIDDYRRMYSRLGNQRHYGEIFTSNPVSGDPYRFFVAGDEPSPDDFVFDVVLGPNADGGPGESFFVVSDDGSLSNDPFNIDENGEIASSRNREFEVVEYAADLINLNEYNIETEVYLAITNQSVYDSSYPEDYIGSTPIDLRDSESVGVVLQRCESVEAAEDLYDGYIEAGNVDSQIEFLGNEWERVFFSDDSPTVYTHLLQVGELVILVDVTQEQWEDRRFGQEELELEEYIGSSVFDR